MLSNLGKFVCKKCKQRFETKEIFLEGFENFNFNFYGNKIPRHLNIVKKNVLQRKSTLASNYDFVIPISLQPDGVDL